MGKAQACCERYLELHQTEDAGRVKGRMLLAKVDKGIQTAGGAASACAHANAAAMTAARTRKTFTQPSWPDGSHYRSRR